MNCLHDSDHDFCVDHDHENQIAAGYMNCPEEALPLALIIVIKLNCGLFREIAGKVPAVDT
jgi:hypothetical protein